MKDAEKKKVIFGVLESPICSVNNAMDTGSPGIFSESKSSKRRTWLKTLSVLSSEEDDMDGESSSVKCELPSDQVWELRFPYPMLSDDSEEEEEESRVFQLEPTKTKGLKRKLQFSDEELEVKNENKSFKEKKRKLHEPSMNQRLPMCDAELEDKLKKRKRKSGLGKKEEQHFLGQQKECKIKNSTKEKPKVSLENLKSECIEMQYADPTSFFVGGALKKTVKAKSSKPRKNHKTSKFVCKPCPPPPVIERISPTISTTNVEIAGGSEEIIVDTNRFLESSDEEHVPNTSVPKVSGRRLHDLSTSSSDSDSEIDKNTPKSKKTQVKGSVKKRKQKPLHLISSSSEDESTSQAVTNEKTEESKLTCDKKTDLGPSRLKQEIESKSSVSKNTPKVLGKKRGKLSGLKKQMEAAKVDMNVEPAKVNTSAWKNIANAQLNRYKPKRSSTSHKSIVDCLKKQLASSNVPEVKIRKQINDISNRIVKAREETNCIKSTSTPKEKAKHEDQAKENMFSENVNTNQHSIPGVFVDSRNPIENNYTVNLNVYCSPSHESGNKEDNESSKNKKESKTSLDINLSLTHSEKREPSSVSKKIRLAHNRRPSLQQNIVEETDGKEPTGNLNKHCTKVEAKLGKDGERENTDEPGIDVLGSILSEMEKNPYKLSKPARNTVEPSNEKPFVHVIPLNSSNAFYSPTNPPCPSGVVNTSFLSSSKTVNEGLSSYSPSINPLKEGLFSNWASGDTLESELFKLLKGNDQLLSQIRSEKPSGSSTSTSNNSQVSSNEKMGAQVPSKETLVNSKSGTEPSKHIVTEVQSHKHSKLVIPFYSVRNEDYNADNLNQDERLPLRTDKDDGASCGINVESCKTNPIQTSLKTDKHSYVDKTLHKFVSSHQSGSKNRHYTPVNKGRSDTKVIEPCVVSNIHKIHFSTDHDGLNKSRTADVPSNDKSNDKEERAQVSSVVTSATKASITKQNRQVHTLSSSEDEEEPSIPSPSNKNQASPKGIRVRFGGSEFRFKRMNQNVVTVDEPKVTEDKRADEMYEEVAETDVPKRKLSSSMESSSGSSSSSSHSSSNEHSDSNSSDDEPEKPVVEKSSGGPNTNGNNNIGDLEDLPCLTEVSLELTKNKESDANQENIYREIITLSSDSEQEHVEQTDIGDSSSVVPSQNATVETSGESSLTFEKTEPRKDESIQVREAVETPTPSKHVGKIRIKSLFELGVVNERSMPENALTTTEAAVTPPNQELLDQNPSKVENTDKFKTSTANSSHSNTQKKLKTNADTKYKSTPAEQTTKDLSKVKNVLKKGTIIGVAKPFYAVKTGEHHRPNIIRLKKVLNPAHKISPRKPSSAENALKSPSSTTSSNKPSTIQPPKTTKILPKIVSKENCFPQIDDQTPMLSTLEMPANTTNISTNTNINSNIQNVSTSDPQSMTFQNPNTSAGQVLYVTTFPTSGVIVNRNNMLLQPGNQSNVPQTSISAVQVQIPLITEQSLDSETLKCFKAFDDFFSELTCMKMPKLIDELHLLITYDIIREEQRLKVGQLLHPEIAASESRRADKDFADKLKTRAQEFVPLLMTLLKRVDEKSLKFSMLALYCRIVQILERINPINVRYRFKLRSLIKSMLDKQVLASTVNIDFFFTQSEDNFVLSFNQMLSNLMRYEVYLDELKRKREEIPQAETTSEVNTTVQDEPIRNIAENATQVEVNKRVPENEKSSINTAIVSEKSQNSTQIPETEQKKTPENPPTQSLIAGEPGKVSKSASLDDRNLQLNHLIKELQSLNQLMTNRNLSRSKSLVDQSQKSPNTSQPDESPKTIPDFLSEHNQMRSTVQSQVPPVVDAPKALVNPNVSTSTTNNNSSTIVPGPPPIETTNINTWTAATLVNTSDTAVVSTTVLPPSIDKAKPLNSSSAIGESKNVQNLPTPSTQQSPAAVPHTPKPGGLDQLFLGKFLKNIKKNDNPK